MKQKTLLNILPIVQMMFLQRLWFQFGHLEQMHLVSAILLFNFRLLDFCSKLLDFYSKLLDFCFFFTLLLLTILFSAELEGFVREHFLLFLLSLVLLSSNISSFTMIQSTQWTLCLQFEFHRGASSPWVYCEARIQIHTLMFSSNFITSISRFVHHIQKMFSWV